MTVAEALQLLDKATASIETNLQTHTAMRQALAVLREATAPKPEPAKKKVKK